MPKYVATLINFIYMNSSANKYASIDAYIKACVKEDQKILQELRNAIHSVVPKAEEAIKYGMPTFILYGNLVHFAAMKNHIGFYPAPSGITTFKKELAKYEQSKGAIRFPKDKPLPLALIKKIVKFRAKENLEIAELRKIKKTR